MTCHDVRAAGSVLSLAEDKISFVDGGCVGTHDHRLHIHGAICMVICLPSIDCFAIKLCGHRRIAFAHDGLDGTLLCRSMNNVHPASNNPT